MNTRSTGDNVLSAASLGERQRVENRKNEIKSRKEELEKVVVIRWSKE